MSVAQGDIAQAEGRGPPPCRSGALDDPGHACMLARKALRDLT